MSIKIIFEAHSTTFDNEAHLASGWNDVKLSPLGETQSIELFKRYEDKNINAIYCSDLQRAYNSVELFKKSGTPVIRDKRLRECNYGDLTQKDASVVKEEKSKRISTPFPNGESYEDCAKRIGEFLETIKENHNNDDIVMIVGHRATQYGLNHHILGHSIEKCVTDPWKWQPGWEYNLDK